jgi:hypothetical protein
MADLKEIEMYLQDNVIKSTVKHFLTFKTKKSAMIYSLQKPCLFEDNFYGDAEIIMSLEEWKEFWIQFEKYY